MNRERPSALTTMGRFHENFMEPDFVSDHLFAYGDAILDEMNLDGRVGLYDLPGVRAVFRAFVSFLFTSFTDGPLLTVQVKHFTRVLLEALNSLTNLMATTDPNSLSDDAVHSRGLLRAMMVLSVPFYLTGSAGRGETHGWMYHNEIFKRLFDSTYIRVAQLAPYNAPIDTYMLPAAEVLEIEIGLLPLSQEHMGQLTSAMFPSNRTVYTREVAPVDT